MAHNLFYYGIWIDRMLSHIDWRISVVNITSNIILNTDSYKASHYLQYPKNTDYVSSYIESRGGEYADTLFFGLQMFLKTYLSTPITQQDIEEAEAVLTAHGEPFNRAGCEYILDKYQGFLPVEIQAVPEGTILPTKNVLVQVVNTDPNCAWLTSYVETALLRAIWYPTTVATISRNCKNLIRAYMDATGDAPESVDFKLQDFGSRGASSAETAAIGGLAHLVNFQGTDTVGALIFGQRYYGEPMAGFSIPAAEHSTITSWGKENEQAAYANMLEQFSGPEKMVAVVSDSYDLFNAIDNIWGEELKEKVESTGGTLVVRPDSGDPVEIVVETIKRLMNKFGFRTNSKGYKVLPDFIRVIQGDGVCLKSIGSILAAMKAEQLSVDNIAFGMGGELLQKVNRDTLKFAMKASAARVDGKWRDVFKDPITDSGKRSKRGRLALIKDQNGKFQTIREDELQKDQDNYLRTVFVNGEMLVDDTFSAIRSRTEG